MIVAGEQYFLMMGCMHFLCLLAAARRLSLPLRPGRALLACAAGACYSLLALVPGGPGNALLPGLCALLSSSVIAFGRQGMAALGPQLAAGLLFAGICGFLQARGLGFWPGFLACCLPVFLYSRGGRPAPAAMLHITCRGRSVTLPCFCDTGNTLHDPVTGLPVIVAPASAFSGLLPPGLRPLEENGLPPGFRLLPAETVAGRKLLPCFRPERLMLQGRPVRALVAITDSPLPRALLPRSIQPKEVFPWRKKACKDDMTPPSVTGS